MVEALGPAWDGGGAWARRERIVGAAAGIGRSCRRGGPGDQSARNRRTTSAHRGRRGPGPLRTGGSELERAEDADVERADVALDVVGEVHVAAAEVGRLDAREAAGDAGAESEEDLGHQGRGGLLDVVDVFRFVVVAVAGVEPPEHAPAPAAGLEEVGLLGPEVLPPGEAQFRLDEEQRDVAAA